MVFLMRQGSKQVGWHRKWGREELIRLFVYHLRVKEGGVWNIWTHPIVLNRNFLPKFYLYLGPKMDPDGPFQSWHPLFVFSLSFLEILRVKWAKDNLEPPELPLLCCFGSCYANYPVFVSIPFLYPFLSTAELPTRCTMGLRWHVYCRGPISNPRPVVDFPAQTTRGKVLDFLWNPKTSLLR